MVARRQQWGIKMSDLMTHKERKRVLGGGRKQKNYRLGVGGCEFKNIVQPKQQKKKGLMRAQERWR